MKTRTELLDVTLQALMAAYQRLCLLGTYDGRNTISGQMELSAMRDAIAEVTGMSSEEVQDQAESGTLARKV